MKRFTTASALAEAYLRVPGRPSTRFPLALPPEQWPDPWSFKTEDETPVENPLSEREMHLLVDAVHSSWKGPGIGRPFAAFADVGLFYSPKQPPIVPDVMLSLDIVHPGYLDGHGRAYFVWVLGKLPEVAIEIVSNKEGGEDTTKLKDYARIGILYYVIHDPFQELGEEILRIYRLKGKRYELMRSRWLPEVRLGLTLWEGVYANLAAPYLRWSDKRGRVLPTGAEAAAEARRQAITAKQSAEDADRRTRDADRRALDADRRALQEAERAELQTQRAELEAQRAAQERERAELQAQRAAQERERAELEAQRAKLERARADRLAERLRQLGIDPETGSKA